MTTRRSRPCGISVYKQIADSIRADIDVGRLGPGDRLPAEDVLASRHHVARMTVRQALQELAADGLVVRRHGAGTFVSNRKIARQATRMTGFHEDLLGRGLNPSSKLLEAKIEPANQKLQQRLRLSGPEPIVFIHRLRLVALEPAAVTTTYFRADLAGPLLGMDVENNSLYVLLENECGLELGWVEQRVDARPASRAVAPLLGVPPRFALLNVERMTYLKDGTLLGVSDSLYRSDRYVLTSVLYR